FVFVVVFSFGMLFFSTARGQAGNLLENPGFENGFFSWNNVPELQVAHGWTPWWIEDANHNPVWRRPEWKPAVGQFYPNRVRSGEFAQQYFTFFGSHYAGIYQQVTNLTPGQSYQFSIYAQVWSSISDNVTSQNPANPRLQIGIDPFGNTNAGFSYPPSTVIWSNEASMANVVDQYGLMTVETIAQNSTITVYIRTSPDFSNKHNDMYFDDASLVAVGTPPPTTIPTPTATPAVQPEPGTPPTATPTPVPPGQAVVYTVQPGDSLGSIANQFGVSYQAIAQQNNILNPNLIYVGQQLIIPNTNTPAPYPTATPTPYDGSINSYPVQVGDTLFSIALRFNSTISAIVTANGLINPNLIYVGQVLIIP
ncbi:MAG: LysM peptidoglycan-binding domain-containing protein, partial [Methylococcales bacterium]|nr:LysM peptidoglycan-binding domain-containing protein [Methylococcales bacterium]